MKGFSSEVSGQMGPALAGPATKAGEDAGRGFTDGLSGTLNSSGAKMSGLGTKLSLGITLPLVAAGFKAVSLASDLNESMSKVNVVFGSSADAIQAWSDGAANSMGLSKKAALDAAGGFGNMFTQLGMGVQPAADMSQSIIGLAADFSSFSNVPVNQVLEAQSAAFRGEYDSLQRFLPLISAATVEQEAMKETGKSSAKQLTAQEKALAVYQLMLQGAGAAQGDFARTADQDANATRRASAEAENAAAAFGQKLLPVKLKLVKAASSLLDWFNRLSPSQQKMAMGAVLAAAALGPVLKVVGLLTQGMGLLIKVGGALGKVLTGAIEYGPKIASGLAQGAKAFADFGVQAAKAAVAVVRAGIEMAISAARTAATFIASVATQIASWVVMGVQALISAAQVALAWLISLGPIALVGIAIIAIAALIITHFDTVKRWVTTAFDFIVTAAQAVWTWVSQNWPLLLAILTGPIGLAVLYITEHWQMISDGFTAVKDWIFARVGDIVGFFLAIPGQIVEAQAAVWAMFFDGASAVASWVGARISDIVGFFLGIWDRASSGVQAIQDGFFAIMSAAKDEALAQIDAIVSFITNMPSRVASAMADLAGTISAPFVTAFDAIRNAWNRTVGGFGISIPSPFPGVSGITMRIPRMHTGGIFQGPNGAKEGLALLQTGEGVIRRNQMDALASSRPVAAQGPSTTTVQLVADDLDRALLEWLRRAIRVQGGGNVQLALGQGSR
jgi:hypothetical protein